MLRSLRNRLEINEYPIRVEGRAALNAVLAAMPKGADVYGFAIYGQDTNFTYELYTDRDYSERYLKTLAGKALDARAATYA
jgi:hypothetical protein